MKPIYVPKGRAGEYGGYAINIYTGCNHGCVYCYAARNAKRWGKDFTHTTVRPGIAEATKRQLEAEKITGKTIHLCFTCDPYPAEPVDTTPTRDIIRAIKESGNHVQILTKGGYLAERDFDLLDGGDLFGVTISRDWATAEIEPRAAMPEQRLRSLAAAKKAGIKTWVSCEPVIHADSIYSIIAEHGYIDIYKIGKLNYHTPEEYGAKPINWGEFGRECERLCKQYGRSYYIKADLRREMEAEQ